MKKYKLTYEWLDDFGDVVRICCEKPLTMKFRCVRVVVLDLSTIEEALF